MCDRTTLLKWQPPWLPPKLGASPQLSLDPQTLPTSSGHVPPSGFPSPKGLLPCPKDFPFLLIPLTHLPNRFLKCRLMCSPSPTARSPAAAGEPCDTRTQRPPAFSAPAGLALPSPNHSTRTARVPDPGPGRSRKQPHNKQGVRIGDPRPGAHRLGAAPHPRRATRCPNPKAQGQRREGKAARGRQAGMEGGSAP